MTWWQTLKRTQVRAVARKQELCPLIKADLKKNKRPKILIISDSEEDSDFSRISMHSESFYGNADEDADCFFCICLHFQCQHGATMFLVLPLGPRKFGTQAP
jgi:hypothetical protein